MEKVNKYKKQIVTLITMVLLVTYGIFPALTAANTLLNLVGGIGALVLLLWAGLELKEYVTSTEGGLIDKAELEEAATMAAKPKVKRKYTKKTNKPDFPMKAHVDVVKKSKTTKTK